MTRPPADAREAASGSGEPNDREDKGQPPSRSQGGGPPAAPRPAGPAPPPVVAEAVNQPGRRAEPESDEDARASTREPDATPPLAGRSEDPAPPADPRPAAPRPPPSPQGERERPPPLGRGHTDPGESSALDIPEFRSATDPSAGRAPPPDGDPPPAALMGDRPTWDATDFWAVTRSQPGAPTPSTPGAVLRPPTLIERVEDLTGQRVSLSLLDPPRPRGDQPMELPDRYRWLATLGQGGQGTVELVQDVDLGRAVALKTLLPHRNDDRQLLELYREARITGQLDHPAIIPIHDAGQLPDGRLYYTMPRMPGESLHLVLSRLRRGDPTVLQRWGLVPLVTAIQRACEGVGFAHERGVIHRDLKPANILLGSHGEVFIVDWGIAKCMDDDRPDRLWSLPGEARTERVRGSPPYMAPEQVKHPDQVTPAADVFCLGVLLYEALTRVPPFRGRSVEQIVEALCHRRPVPPRERAPDRSIPPDLQEICLRALEKFPGHRQANATELGRELGLWLSGGKRRSRASRRVREAEALRGRHAVLLKRAEAARQTLLRAQGPAGPRGPAEGAELAARHEQQRSLERAADGVFSEGVWALQRAIRDDPDNGEAQRMLGELYGDRYAEAERRGADREQAFFRALLRQLDDGRWARWLRTGAELRAECLPEDEPLQLLRLRDDSGRLVSGEALDPDPDGAWSLPPGRYALRAPDREWTYPIRLDREDQRHLLLDRRGESDAGELFCFVPGGPGTIGGDLRAPGSGPLDVALLPPFAIARHPVTVGAWARFQAWIEAEQPREARALCPRNWDSQRVAGDTRPLTGVNLAQAQAYCRWMSELTGLRIRLPRPAEWEKSGRAADARAFPWGDSFDPTACACLWTCEPEEPAPPVGSFPADRSPFGVEDLAGGVWEWTDTSTAGRAVVVGGCHRSEPDGCRLASRRSLRITARLPTLGFRVLRELA